MTANRQSRNVTLGRRCCTHQCRFCGAKLARLCALAVQILQTAARRAFARFCHAKFVAVSGVVSSGKHLNTHLPATKNSDHKRHKSGTHFRRHLTFNLSLNQQTTNHSTCVLATQNNKSSNNNNNNHHNNLTSLSNNNSATTNPVASICIIYPSNTNKTLSSKPSYKKLDNLQADKQAKHRHLTATTNTQDPKTKAIPTT